MGVKVVHIGAGSYVFTPSILHDLICHHRIADLDLWLVDRDAEAASWTGAIARRMADRAGVRVRIETAAEREGALPGADFVSTSVAVDGLRRWQTDRAIARKYDVIEVAGELGGVGGLAYTLRQVPLLLGICRDMERTCPRAVLLNVSNPLPRILSAITSETGIRAFGLCNAACGGTGDYDHLARLLDRPNASFRAVSAGTNHFNWLLAIRDVETDEDLYPEVRRVVERGGMGPLARRCLGEVGLLPLSGDTHVGEFLPFDPGVMTPVDAAFHGTAGERDRRRASLARMAAGALPWEPLLEHRAWERPADVIHAMVTGSRLALTMLNLRNDGAMPELPDEAIVEMPAIVEGATLRASPVGPLPDPLQDLLLTTSMVNMMAGQAAARADRGVLHDCIDADPAITNKNGAHDAIEDILVAHADLLPDWRV